VELYQLKGFATVADEGHLTRAAERLHMSQPALSAQIKALEEELGMELFDRLPGGMALTAPGKRLLASARRVIEAAAALQREALMLRGEVVGKVRLGTLSDPGFVRLPVVLAEAVQRFPLLEIELHQEVSGAAFAKVREGELDASFYYGDLEDPDVGSMELREIGFRVVGPAAWKERIQGAKFADLTRLPWILTPPISTHRVLSEALFSKHRVKPETLLEADNEAVIRSLVVAGLGVALMREDLANELAESGEVVVWEGTRLPTKLRFVWGGKRGQDPDVSALRELVREAWSDVTA
jgi:DNA-binding transcriptional LysR family regulator